VGRTDCGTVRAIFGAGVREAAVISRRNFIFTSSGNRLQITFAGLRLVSLAKEQKEIKLWPKCKAKPVETR
jgi:hypothetical protein